MKKLFIFIVLLCVFSLFLAFFYQPFVGAFAFLLLGALFSYENANALTPMKKVSFGNNSIKAFFQRTFSLEKYQKFTYVGMIIASTIGFVWFISAMVAFIMR
ncbi:MAG: hypothetical protein E7666_06360 [Ruminococcaceae bacterium]|nr:hypothetical protein [Oscillospiraceae bacterium]